MISFLCDRPPARLRPLGACGVACLFLATAAMAQVQDPVRILPVDVPSKAVVVQVDSGQVVNLGDRMEPVYETVVGDEGATWLRVFFGPQTRILPGSQLRITSLLDGAVQLLDAETIVQWNHSTAYFNGDQVKIEILAGGGSSGNRITVDLLHAGLSGGATESICGTDDRVLSSDPRAARLLSGGCTGWLINECFLTAGHCLSNTVAQFNVPLSSSTGSLNHPPPSDQYSIDAASKQGIGGGVGNDWGYFGVFDNSTTGLSALEAQGGARYGLATNMPGVSGQDIRITGYGVDSTPYEYNQVQQTNAGPFRELAGTTVRYETDTTGGNSGSAVHDLALDKAIGIHTHAGCDSSPPPYNQGTAISHANLQNALRNPAGVCAGQAACTANGICEAGEDCYNCPSDCAYAPPDGGGGAPICGNNLCEVAQGEDCLGCPADCNGQSTGRPSSRYCCGSDVGCEDPRCTGGGNTCTTDPPSGVGFCCGDSTCEGDETPANCAVDCTVGCTVNEDCTGGDICCGGVCAPPVCTVDSDCDDGDACTLDTCMNPSGCSATCDNAFPSCGLADGCCGPGCDSSNDPDCCAPTHNKEKGPRCSDGLDNDCDGLIDGADPDC